ncbi:DMT family transporter [Defluviimonas sp. D31]|uniref:DMT family transporter n=1 Tax=Albidovulum salinarum TaxID=2984153 RepID=A0ABT2X0C6_9RHOB|nr:MULTISPECIES: DMT family transporter [unclassified Defluviimonas]MCU9847391.1 DMT family transporter [Defluviimonas sp. WL0024]MDW4550989.1 DMT family transporter [Defluviimonas sp. D31]
MDHVVSYRKGVGLVLFAAVLWSLMGLAIRSLGDAGTWQVLFYRSLGMAPVLFLTVAYRSGGRPFQRIRAAGWPGFIGGFGLVFAFAGAIYAIQSTTVANAVFLFAAAPLFTAVMAWLILKEPVRRATWGAIALAGIGMFVMVREGLAIGAGWGNVAALFSAAGFSAFTIALRWGRVANMLPSVLIGGVLSVIVAGAVIALRGESFALPPRSIAIAMLMGAALLGFGLAIYTTGSRVVEAAELGLLTMAEVMLAPVWVWLVLGESASSGTFIGGAVLLAAIAFNAATGMRHRPPALTT